MTHRPPLDKASPPPPLRWRIGGEYCAIWLGPEMPATQTARRCAAICFDSGPLINDGYRWASPRCIWRPGLRQTAGADAVRLKPYPSTAPSPADTTACLNLKPSRRANTAGMNTGRRTDITLDLDTSPTVFPKGHRLRCRISTHTGPALGRAEAAEVTLSSAISTCRSALTNGATNTRLWPAPLPPPVGRQSQLRP